MSIRIEAIEQTRFIAGDWGTSNLRLYLCEYSSTGARILETRFGQGISQINGDFEEYFFNLTQDWIDQNDNIPVLLSGMVGSTIGWKEAPYLACPVNAQQIADGRLKFTVRGVSFSILSGLRVNNPLGAPDVMRGEELQLLGWLSSQDVSTSNNKKLGQPARRLFALPGTHNKWALAEHENISTFLTAFTGELFALLRKHSILITEQSAFSFNRRVFMEGVESVAKMGEAQLLHVLFSTRAKQVLGEIATEDGLSYLSGQIISADVKGALALFNSQIKGTADELKNITIIGEEALSKHYQLVANYYHLEAEICDPSSIAIAGFETIYRRAFANI